MFPNFIVTILLVIFLTLRHFINKSCCQFLFWFNICNNPCFSKYIYYFLNSSFYMKNINELFEENYDIENISDNDAILSRFCYLLLSIKQPFTIVTLSLIFLI